MSVFIFLTPLSNNIFLAFFVGLLAFAFLGMIALELEKRDKKKDQDQDIHTNNLRDL